MAWMLMRVAAVAVAVCIVQFGAMRAVAGDLPWTAIGRNVMVAADHPLASQAGLDVLRAGGNAADAAIAVSLALGVTRPESTGLGGGGFFIYRNGRTGEVSILDYRECAPAAATADMFVRAREKDPAATAPSENGPLAVAVPGLPAGLAEIHRRFGTKPYLELARRAIELADGGFPIDDYHKGSIQSALKDFAAEPQLQKTCGYVYATHLHAGAPPEAGARLAQPALARLIRELAEHGEESFYRGAIATDIASAVHAGGGLITAADLAAYRVRERRPLVGSYRGYEIITMPPPSSGGIVLLECLNILETVDLAAIGRNDRAAAWHYVIEAMKLAFADRAAWLGDSDFVDVPTDRLVSKDYARSQAARIRPDSALKDVIAPAPPPDDAGTSHFCIVDRDGNVVVSTETINTTFGSKFAVDKWGLILNNEMDDFTTEPGRPNAFGLRQSERNNVAGGKRPLSCMTPVIVLRDGQVVLMLGASGGPRIITAVLDVIVRRLDFGEELPAAVAAPRPHHQWQPDHIFFDQAPPADLATGLTQRGHVITDERRKAAVQAIARISEGWQGASDPRKGGHPMGY
jgi:gamma-glutamyltranspeptidase/glutathione hydrolase